MALRGPLARALTRNAMLVAMGSNVSPRNRSWIPISVGIASAALANKREVDVSSGRSLRSVAPRQDERVIAVQRARQPPHIEYLGPEPGVRSKSVHFVCLVHRHAVHTGTSSHAADSSGAKQATLGAGQ